MCYIFDEVRANRCVQNKTMLKFAENHANWFRRFEDMSNVVASRSGLVYWSTLCIVQCDMFV